MALEPAPGFDRALAFTGRIVPQRRAALAFEVGGRVAEVLVDDGDLVAAGAPLARLDTDRLRARLTQQRADLADAKASAALAAVTAKRQQELLAKGHVPPQAYDEARFNADSARARVRRIEAAIAATEIDLDDSVLRAPFDALITRRHIDEGVVVTAGSAALDLEQDAPAEARIGVPARFLPALSPGSRHALRAQDVTFEAVLRDSVAQIDPATQTAMTVFELPSGRRLPSDALVTLTLVEHIDKPGFWLPMAALTRDLRGLWAVLAAVPSEIDPAAADIAGDVFEVERRSVEILHFESDRAFVRGPLAAGDRIVESGIHRLVPGQQVTPAADTVAAR